MAPVLVRGDPCQRLEPRPTIAASTRRRARQRRPQQAVQRPPVFDRGSRPHSGAGDRPCHRTAGSRVGPAAVFIEARDAGRGRRSSSDPAQLHCLPIRSGASAPRASPADAGGVLTSTTKEAPDGRVRGQQFVGIDLHRRRSVIVRTTEAGEVLETVRIVNDVDRLTAVIARAGEEPEVVLEATYGWYWAVDALQAAGAPGASGASVGGEGVRVPAGEERRAGRRRPGGSAADGPAARGVDRAAGHPGAARAGAAPGQAGRAALALQGRGARGAGQVRDPGADERPVRGGRHRAAGPAPAAGAVRGPGRLAAPADGRPGLRDRPVHRPGPGPAGPRPRLHRGAAASPGSARSWPRCSSPRSATSPGSPPRRSWPAGPG